MLFFPKMDKQSRRLAREAMRPGWQRPLLMALLWLAVGTAFWYHFQNRFTALSAQSAIVIDSQIPVSDKASQALADHVFDFKKRWGLNLIVRAVPDLEVPPEVSNTGKGPTVFVGVDTGSGHVEIILPGHIARLLRGPEGDQRATMEMMLRLCAMGIPDCLVQTLDQLARAIDAAP